MNIRKLRKLQRWILAEPRRYAQDWWLYGKESMAVQKQKPPCGTAACLAGSACLMEGYKPTFEPDSVMGSWVRKGKKRFHVPELGRDILGLVGHQEKKLFRADGEGFSARSLLAYRKATTPLQRAKAACMAIDDLIKSSKEKTSGARP